MRTKTTFFYVFVTLTAAICMLFIQTETSFAESMTLKISHQFAAGDVRDQMGLVFGEMVT